MPTYEYRCPMGHQFERFQRMSDPPQAECPECGRVAERLLSTGAGLLFKGSGFYITDYRSDSYRKAAEAEGGGKDGKAAGAGEGPPAKGAGESGGAGAGESGRAGTGGTGSAGAGGAGSAGTGGGSDGGPAKPGPAAG